MTKSLKDCEHELECAESDLADAQNDGSDAKTIVKLRNKVEAAKAACKAARSVNESYEPMALLKEMLLTEKKKVPLKKAAKSVYHRDYVKTKNKPYRKYDPAEYKKEKGE